MNPLTCKSKQTRVSTPLVQKAARTESSICSQWNKVKTDKKVVTWRVNIRPKLSNDTQSHTLPISLLLSLHYSFFRCGMKGRNKTYHYIFRPELHQSRYTHRSHATSTSWAWLTMLIPFCLFSASEIKEWRRGRTGGLKGAINGYSVQVCLRAFNLHRSDSDLSALSPLSELTCVLWVSVEHLCTLSDRRSPKYFGTSRLFQGKYGLK